MLAVDHELFRAQAGLARVLVNALGDRHAVVPGRGGMDVHLDHAGIGGHADHVQARVVRGRIALDMDLQVQAQGRGLDRVQQVQVFLQRGDRRHEHAQPPVLGFHGERGAHGSLQFPVPGAGHLGDDILARRAGHEHGMP